MGAGGRIKGGVQDVKAFRWSWWFGSWVRYGAWDVECVRGGSEGAEGVLEGLEILHVFCILH